MGGNLGESPRMMIIIGKIIIISNMERRRVSSCLRLFRFCQSLTFAYRFRSRATIREYACDLSSDAMSKLLDEIVRFVRCDV